MGNLYIVATPIGNLQDITYRAVHILESVEYIACEDTRKTGILLKNLGVVSRPTLISFYEQNEDQRIPNILNILIDGKDVALVSDSGTPTISDPGFRLVREATLANIKVISVPGPNAAISAIASSGLPTDKFTFVGFLPKKQGNRLTLLKKIKSANEIVETTIVIYEAPHRVVKVLKDIEKVFGDIQITLMRELTKIYEEKITDSISNLVLKYEKESPRGEFVILFNTKQS